MTTSRTPENALWVDDIRAPERYERKEWTWVTNYPDAIKALQTGKIREVSLDGSLETSHVCMKCKDIDCYFGLPGPCACGCHIKRDAPDGRLWFSGLDILEWMRANNIKPEKIYIHTISKQRYTEMSDFLKAWSDKER